MLRKRGPAVGAIAGHDTRHVTNAGRPRRVVRTRVAEAGKAGADSLLLLLLDHSSENYHDFGLWSWE